MTHNPESAFDRPVLPRAQYQTISVCETHAIGPDRRPVYHAIAQKIVALRPVRLIPCYFDTNEVERFSFDSGCTLGDRRPAPEANFHMVELVLTPPLDTGEQTTLEYTTWFNYSAPPAPEYRRRIGAKAMSTLDISLHFEKGYEPRHIWEAQWPSANAGVPALPESLVAVDPYNVPDKPNAVEVRRQETDVQPGVVLGFAWEW